CSVLLKSDPEGPMRNFLAGDLIGNRSDLCLFPATGEATFAWQKISTNTFDVGFVYGFNVSRVRLMEIIRHCLHKASCSFFRGLFPRLQWLQPFPLMFGIMFWLLEAFLFKRSHRVLQARFILGQLPLEAPLKAAKSLARAPRSMEALVVPPQSPIVQ